MAKKRIEDKPKVEEALDFKVKVKFKNKKQKEYHNLIKEKEVTFCSGEAGTGKSYISLATALELLSNRMNCYERILIVVPTVQSDMEIGFLKGTKEEKIAPFLEADYYTLEKIFKNSGLENPKQKLGQLIQEGKIVGDCVSFMRGKTIDNTIVLVNECENFSKQALYLLLTRIGENSKYVFSGDIKQLDRKDIKKSGESSGLEYAIEKLVNLDEIGICQFTRDDIVRNPLITKIMDSYY